MNVKIYQAYFKNDQISKLDPAFIPHNNIENLNPIWRVYWLFLQHYKSKRFRESDYSGILSWRYGEKTSVPGSDFTDFINNNPGYDVYFINPFPHLCYYDRNVWDHGERYHPGITEMAQSLMDRFGHEIKLKDMISGETDTLYCDYWVGNPDFWEKYMKFTLPIYNYISDEVRGKERELLYSVTENATYLAYVFERLFPTFLALNKNIKFISYRYSIDELAQKYNTVMLSYIVNNRMATTIKTLNKSEENNLLTDFSRLNDFYLEYINNPDREIDEKLQGSPKIYKTLKLLCKIWSVLHGGYVKLFRFITNYSNDKVKNTDRQVN